VTSFLHGTEPVLPCSNVHSWYGVDVIWYAAGVIPYSVQYSFGGFYVCFFA
jgi:hypothetical protein